MIRKFCFVFWRDAYYVDVVVWSLRLIVLGLVAFGALGVLNILRG